MKFETTSNIELHEALNVHQNLNFPRLALLSRTAGLIKINGLNCFCLEDCGLSTVFLMSIRRQSFFIPHKKAPLSVLLFS